MIDFFAYFFAVVKMTFHSNKFQRISLSKNAFEVGLWPVTFPSLIPFAKEIHNKKGLFRLL